MLELVLQFLVQEIKKQDKKKNLLKIIIYIYIERDREKKKKRERNLYNIYSIFYAFLK
jgi:hypothetical protein